MDSATLTLQAVMPQIRHEQEILGIDPQKLNALIHNHVKDNANVKSNPESLNLAIAEYIKRQYYLDHVIPKPVADAHKEGLIYIHDLGLYERPYCGSHSVPYLIKYGLKLTTVDAVSNPAKYADVLVGHFTTWLATMQTCYAGALGFGYINIFMAPFLIGKTQEEIRQLAQMLTFKVAQTAFSRGGQSVFTDFNVHPYVPDYLYMTAALGPGGKYMYPKDEFGEYIDYDPDNIPLMQRRLYPEGGFDYFDDLQPIPVPPLMYGELEKVAQEFAIALLDCAAEGDARGLPFTFPKIIIHWDEKVENECQNVVEATLRALEANGSPYIAYDRGGVSVSSCCRLKANLDEGMVETLHCAPESIRTAGIQNVSINLPHIAFKTGNEIDFYEELKRALDLADQAHLTKKQFISNLLKEGEHGILAQLVQDFDGKPYIRLDDSMATYLFGIIGLQEAVLHLYGVGLDTEEGHKKGLEIIKFMKEYVEKLGKKHGLQYVLEESPAESSAWSLCQRDRQLFPDLVDKYVSTPGDSAYYTNSVHIPYESPVETGKRLKWQGEFTPYIKGGSITHVWIGDHKPSKKALLQLIKATRAHTEVDQLAISPEFTVCEDCGKVSRGLKDKCPYCDSDKVDHMTRITGYFTMTSQWNKGKQSELANRRKVGI